MKVRLIIMAKNIYRVLISYLDYLTSSDWIILWLYLLIAPAIIIGLFTNLIVLYFKFYFIFSLALLLVFLIRYLSRVLTYHASRKISHKLSCGSLFSAFNVALLVTFAILLIIYSPLLINWDAVSIYIPIAESIVKTGSLHGPNVYYQTYQTMYAPPLTPLLMAFFISNVSAYGYRLVPILFTIFLFVILKDLFKMFINNAADLALISFFVIITNPFYILYFIKESLYLDLAFVTMSWAMIYELLKLIMFKDANRLYSVILWLLASMLLMVSKEYGVFLFVASFTLILSLKMEKGMSFIKYFLSILFTLPFLSIYIITVHRVGLTFGVASQILGSGILASLAYLFYRLFYRYAARRLLKQNILEKFSLLEILITVISVSMPAILYYVAFAIKYGVLGFLNFTWIQKKFIPEEIFAMITSLSIGRPPIQDIIYLRYFNYWNILNNVGTFIIFATSFPLLSFVVMYYRKRGQNNDVALNHVKVLLLVLSMILIYYLAAVDLLNSINIVGGEYRRSMLIISFFSTLTPIVISLLCEEAIINKLLLLIWALLNVILHVTIVNPLKLPYSYLGLCWPPNTIVPNTYLVIVFILSTPFLLFWLFKHSTKILDLESKVRFRISLSHNHINIVLTHLTKIIILIFTTLILINQVIFISMRNWDHQWYNTIYSIKAYYQEWGKPWIDIYELLKDKNNSITLLESSYPLAYFLKRPVIVYGNINSLWFTSNGLLIKVMNASGDSVVYIVRNKELSSLKGLFESLINKLNSTAVVKKYSLIYKGKNLEVYELEIIRISQ